MPAIVEDCKPLGKSGYKVIWRVVAEKPAGLVIPKVWRYHTLDSMSANLGFGRWDKPPYFENPAQLFQLRALLHLMPGDTLQFRQLSCSASMRKWNRDLLMAREVDIDRQCVLGDMNLPCYNCDLGLDRCINAIREKTLERGECDICGDEKTLLPWAPEDSRPGKYCASCYHERIHS